MPNKDTTPLSLYGNDREYLREQEKTNELLADIAGEEYESPGDIPNGKYVIQKRLLDAAQKKNELLESIAEGGGGGGGGAAKAIGIDYATDVISLKNKDGETIAGSGATLPAYGVSFDPTTGGLTLTKNGTAVSGQTVTIPNYGSPVGVTSSSDMTDHDTIYLYEGTTSGSYTKGHFYYWDGYAWADGGEYAAATVQTDKTLLVEDRAADAKATGEAVGELKTQFDLLQTKGTADNWEKGNFDTQTGANNSIDSYIRNQNFYGIFNGTTRIEVSDGYLMLLFAWKLDGTFVGSYKTTGIFDKTLSNYGMISTFNCAEFPNYKIKISFRRDPTSSEIDPSEGQNCSLYFYTDKTLSNEGKPADAKAVGDEVNELKTQMDEFVISYYELITPINWHNTETDTTGYVMKADGSIVETSDRFYTDFIPVKENDKVYQFYFSGNTRMSQYRRNVCCFNSSKEVVEGGNNSAAVSYFTVPAGVAYVRITFETSGRSNIVVTVNTIPNTKPSYFEPYFQLADDMVTPDSKAALDEIKGQKYGCALPKDVFKMTQGISETWYYINCATPPTQYICISVGVEYMQKYNDKIVFPNINTLASTVGYQWQHYNNTMQKIDDQEGDVQYGQWRYILAENLYSCSLLAIGDSTVDQDVMTQKMLDYFTSKGLTLTLLGTLGSGGNRNEGRAGWKATDYLTNKQYSGVVNPFYNPTSETFDFSYYMTNQGYAAPDFVVLQLGINDLYYTYDTAFDTTWNAIKTMIDSIIAYNSSIKIFLNLPTPPNTDESKMSNIGFLYRNSVVRYNQFATAQAKALYGTTKVRPTYCHLILDPSTDIRDDVHPTADGYEKMALEVINQINCWQNGH